MILIIFYSICEQVNMVAEIDVDCNDMKKSTLKCLEDMVSFAEEMLTSPKHSKHEIAPEIRGNTLCEYIREIPMKKYDYDPIVEVKERKGQKLKRMVGLLKSLETLTSVNEMVDKDFFETLSEIKVIFCFLKAIFGSFLCMQLGFPRLFPKLGHQVLLNTAGIF